MPLKFRNSMAPSTNTNYPESPGTLLDFPPEQFQTAYQKSSLEEDIDDLWEAKFSAMATQHYTDCVRESNEHSMRSAHAALANLSQPGFSATVESPVQTRPGITFDGGWTIEDGVPFPSSIEESNFKPFGPWCTTRTLRYPPALEKSSDVKIEHDDQIENARAQLSSLHEKNKRAVLCSLEQACNSKRKRGEEDNEAGTLAKLGRVDGFELSEDKSDVGWSARDDWDLEVERRCYQATREDKSRTQTQAQARAQAEAERFQVAVKFELPQPTSSDVNTETSLPPAISQVSELRQKPEELIHLRSWAELFLQRIREMERNMRTVNGRRDQLGGLFRLTVEIQKEIKALKANSERYGRCRAGCRDMDEYGLDEYNSDETVT